MLSLPILGIRRTTYRMRNVSNCHISKFHYFGYHLSCMCMIAFISFDYVLMFNCSIYFWVSIRNLLCAYSWNNIFLTQVTTNINKCFGWFNLDFSERAQWRGLFELSCSSVLNIFLFYDISLLCLCMYSFLLFLLLGYIKAQYYY